MQENGKTEVEWRYAGSRTGGTTGPSGFDCGGGDSQWRRSSLTGNPEGGRGDSDRQDAGRMPVFRWVQVAQDQRIATRRRWSGGFFPRGKGIGGAVMPESQAAARISADWRLHESGGRSNSFCQKLKSKEEISGDGPQGGPPPVDEITQQWQRASAGQSGGWRLAVRPEAAGTRTPAAAGWRSVP